MPTTTLKKQAQMAAANADPEAPKALRNTHLWDTQGYGSPRYQDLVTARTLEQTHTLQIPIGTIKEQIATTPITVRPTVDDPTDAHWDAAEQVLEWLQGNFNPNRESFSHFLKQITNDILSIDAGVIELIPDSEGLLWGMKARDGAAFTKDPDEHGFLPEPGSDDTAYWQFGAGMGHLAIDRDKTFREALLEQQQVFSQAGMQKPVAFTRDEICWIETNPRSWHDYGLGRVQIVQRVVEIIANQDVENKRFFTSGELADLIMSLPGFSDNDLENFKEFWTDEVVGQEHVAPMVNHEVDVNRLRPPLQDLQFLESQEWYHKLVWFAFGVPVGEVGESAEVNRATAESHRGTMWEKTTRPLMHSIEQEINDTVLIFHPAWHEVDGELEFAFDPDFTPKDAERRRRQTEDLANGLATINEVRQERGEEEVPWGDLPDPLLQAVARNHPEWALEHWADVDDPPESDPGMGLLGANPNGGGPHDPDNDDGAAATQSRPRSQAPTMQALATERDALRDTDEGEGDEIPRQARRVISLASQLGTIIERELTLVLEDLQDEWPNQDEAQPDRKAFAPDLETLVGTIRFAPAMKAAAVAAGEDALQESVDTHAENLEEEINDLVEDEPELELDLDVEDTAALKRLEENAGWRMEEVEDTVKERINRTLSRVAEGDGTVGDMTEALREEIDAITSEHARTVARTEVMDASREGSQALAESTSVVNRKEWMATSDARTRPWHDAMDEETVPVDGSFTVPDGWEGKPHYQPSDYPREAFKVGDDQPYRCRCEQLPVVAEDRFPDMESLARCPDVKRAHAPDYATVETEKQRVVLFCHAEPGEGLTELLDRVKNEERLSSRKALDRLGIGSLDTLYGWGWKDL
ncbi:hypothetical protein BRD56_05380 [Thermoplasmatales archaeon SW_10_69_26]|nr:MAG: hypothetical protein BRD56_05380 [Thermoplasmatales archaeon SW_10_69_26]